MSASGDAQRAVGARLRDVRKALGMSLADVEIKSQAKWKAVVIGSYERGDRAITVGRLVDLAAFYRVPAWELLKPGEPAAPTFAAVLAEAQRHSRAAADLLAKLATDDPQDGAR